MVWKHSNMLGIYVWYVKKNQEGRVFSHYKNDQQTLWMGQTRFESTAAKTQQVAVERPANQSLQWHQQNGLWRNGTKMYHACLRAGSNVILVHFSKDLIMFDFSVSLLVTAGALLLSPSLPSACESFPKSSPGMEVHSSISALCNAYVNDLPSPGSTLHKASFRRAKRPLLSLRFLRVASIAGKTMAAKLALQTDWNVERCRKPQHEIWAFISTLWFWGKLWLGFGDVLPISLVR